MFVLVVRTKYFERMKEVLRSNDQTNINMTPSGPRAQYDQHNVSVHDCLHECDVPSSHRAEVLDTTCPVEAQRHPPLRVMLLPPIRGLLPRIS